MAAEPQGTPDPLDQARLEYCRNPTSSYAASQLLHLLRLSKGDPAQIYEESKPIRDRFPEDQWVNRRFFWICYDLLKLLIQRDQLYSVPSRMQEALDVFSRTGDQPDIPLQQLAYLFGQAVRKAKDKPGALTQFWSQLADVGFRFADSVLPLLSTEPITLAGGKRSLSSHDLFLFGLRRAADEGERWDLLHTVSVNAIMGQWPVADRKWFLLAFLEASCHLPPDSPVPDGFSNLYAEYSDDANIRSAYAAWCAAKLDQDGALTAYRTAAAIARTPWPWEKYARFLASQGDTTTAISCFKAALSWSDSSEPGFVWKVHFTLARLLLDSGEIEEAAAEARLARWCRRISGWRVDGDLEHFITSNDKLATRCAQSRDDASLARESKSRQRLYFQARVAHMRSPVSPSTISRTDPEHELTSARANVSPAKDALLP